MNSWIESRLTVILIAANLELLGGQVKLTVELGRNACRLELILRWHEVCRVLRLRSHELIAPPLRAISNGLLHRSLITGRRCLLVELVLQRHCPMEAVSFRGRATVAQAVVGDHRGCSPDLLLRCHGIWGHTAVEVLTVTVFTLVEWVAWIHKRLRRIQLPFNIMRLISVHVLSSRHRPAIFGWREHRRRVGPNRRMLLSNMLLLLLLLAHAHIW